MVKEFGKNKNSKAKSAAGGGFLRQLMLLFLAFVCGYLAASLVSFSDARTWLAAKVSPIEATPKKKQTAKSSDLPKPKFEFYTLLAKEQSAAPIQAETKNRQASPRPPKPKTETKSSPVVTATPVTSTTEKQQNHASPTHRYAVQIASFKRKLDAERMKASLILKGFDTQIAAVNQQGVTWYRVLIGPFDSRIQAEKAQVQVARSERVMGMIRKMEG